MIDKKKNESKISEDKKTETESEQGFSTSISLTPAIEQSSDGKPKQPEKSKTQKSVNENKPTMKTSEKVKTPSTLKNTKENNQKLSKIAVLALIVALLAATSVGGLFYLSIEKQEKFEQQQALAENNILQKTQQSLANSERQIKQLLDQQQKRVSKQLTQDIASIENDSQVKINELTKVVERLSQNQPSDWLLHEAEYLIRIATRTLWLEHDTQAAIGLLQDADLRLKELENPEFLPIRQLIRQDIAQLTLMPSIDSEDTILTLMAMNQQLKSLPVKSERIPENFVTQVELDLSEDIADWKDNLDKTWQYFADSFFRISDRSGKTEALLSPQFQQNLRENLSLKLQLAQWSASKGKQKIYDQTLIDIQGWLTQFFDMTAIENENFHQEIEQLKNEIVNYDYPATLSSLQAIRKALTTQPLKPVLEQLEQENKAVNSVIETPQETQVPKLTEQPESTSEAL
jgi:uroporphyrin-3 C-methyltransferase